MVGSTPSRSRPESGACADRASSAKSSASRKSLRPRTTISLPSGVSLFTQWCQQDMTPVALHEAHCEPILQFVQTGAEGRLGDVAGSSGAAKMLMLGQGREEAELLQTR